jgi:biotin operon repressor
MNSVPLQKIENAAQYIAAVGELQDLLQKEPMDSPRVAAMAIALVSQAQAHLAAPVKMAIAIMECVKSGPMTNAEIAKKIGRSPESVRQAIEALKHGGVELQESSAGNFRATGRPYVLHQYRTARPLFEAAAQAQAEAAEATSFEGRSST